MAKKKEEEKILANLGVVYYEDHHETTVQGVGNDIMMAFGNLVIDLYHTHQKMPHNLPLVFKEAMRAAKSGVGKNE